MESSTVVAFRALVMLACLIVVPLAAILGSAFPEVVRSVVLEKLGHKPAQTASTPAPEAPRFGQFAPAPTAAPGYSTNPAAPNWNNAQQSNAAPASAWTGTAPPLSINAGPSPAAQSAPPGFKQPEAPSPFAAKAEEVAPNWTQPQQPFQSGGPFQSMPGNGQVSPAGGPMSVHDQTSVVQIPVTGGGSVVPVNGESRAMQQPPTANPPGSPFANGPAMTGGYQPSQASTAGPPAQQTDRFSAIERRLRDYGATYYRLETWGDAGEFYRFHCKMAVGNNPNYTQQFEATDGDALKAMVQVLEQVEAWRGRMN